jgi:hypothetical protein
MANHRLGEGRIKEATQPYSEPFRICSNDGRIRADTFRLDPQTESQAFIREDDRIAHFFGSLKKFA